jgi:hypothetical protein
LDYHGLSPKQLETLQSKLENTQSQLEAENITGLSKHEVVGDLMQSAVMSYMAITDVQSKIAAQSSGMVYYREPSYGTFQTNAKTNGLLGTVANVEMTGLLMDMDSMKFSTECKSNCQDQWRDFNQQMGSAYSAYEHLIPEQLFSTADDPIEGVSAVKALAIASQQGQRIYTFTQDNLGYLSDLTVDQGTKDEILAQVNAGMVATVHQHPISYAGWSGAGYTIVDPETGAGGYKISGGSDGFEIIVEDSNGDIVFSMSVPLPAMMAGNSKNISRNGNVLTSFEYMIENLEKLFSDPVLFFAGLIAAIIMAVVLTYVLHLVIAFAFSAATVPLIEGIIGIVAGGIVVIRMLLN